MDGQKTKQDERRSTSASTDPAQPFTSIASLLPAVASVVLLVMAVVERWPYGFYVLLRTVVCVSSVYLATKTTKLHRSFWAWAMAALAVLYNPVMPIRMGRSDWEIVNLWTVAVFVAFGVALFWEKFRTRAKA